jgi:hypothetical protein
LSCDALKIEAAWTSETVVSDQKTTWRYNQEDFDLKPHRRERLKALIKFAVSADGIKYGEYYFRIERTYFTV